MTIPGVGQDRTPDAMRQWQKGSPRLLRCYLEKYSTRFAQALPVRFVFSQHRIDLFI
jgi:hypothetical protein